MRTVTTAPSLRDLHENVRHANSRRARSGDAGSTARMSDAAFAMSGRRVAGADVRRGRASFAASAAAFGGSESLRKFAQMDLCGAKNRQPVKNFFRGAETGCGGIAQRSRAPRRNIAAALRERAACEAEHLKHSVFFASRASGACRCRLRRVLHAADRRPTRALRPGPAARKKPRGGVDSGKNRD